MIPPKKQQATRSRVQHVSHAKDEVVDDGKEKVIALHVPLAQVSVNKENPRKNFSHEAMEELIASIKEHGILQPLLVQEKHDGSYDLIAGERRFRAATMLNLLTVPVIVKQTKDSQEKLEIALIENIQRDDLNIIEEACAYQRFVEEFGLSPTEVGNRVGKARSTVANIMRLLNLPDKIQKACIDGRISMGKARALLAVKEPQEQDKMFESFLGEGMTVRDVEKAVQTQKRSKGGKGLVRKDANLLDAEDQLRKKLGTKVRITRRGERGKIEIDYFSVEEFKNIIDLLLS